MDQATYDKGLDIRTSVLGRSYVENSIKNADDLSKPLQDLVTEYCWGAVWGRDGLDRRSRSLINLAMLSALNRPHELEVHVKGAINNGVTREEIIEVLLQVAIYCGVPASLDAVRVARKALSEITSK
jgi:4-carboxymuconolactone decarboxylase